MPGAVHIAGLLTPGEAAVWAGACAALGFAPKRSRRPGPPIRAGLRLKVAPPPGLQDALAAALRPHLPPLPGWTPARGPELVNPVLRVNLAGPGQPFGPHFDTGHAHHPWRRTLWSALIALQQAPTGGHTRFFPDGRAAPELSPAGPDRAEVQVRLESGDALVFWHHGPGAPWHAGEEPYGGDRILLRLDLLGTRPRPSPAHLLTGGGPEDTPCVVLIGPAGAGKSTLAAAAAPALGLAPVGLGAAVRAVARDPDHPLHTPLLTARAARDAAQGRAPGAPRRPGGLLPGGLAAALVRSATPAGARGLLLDGWPRTRAQALQLEPVGDDTRRLQLAALLELPDVERRARVAARVDPGTGQRRADDGPEDHAARDADHAAHTLPWLPDLEKRRQLVRLDAREAPDALRDALIAAVRARRLAEAGPALGDALRAALLDARPTADAHGPRVWRLRAPGGDRFLKMGPTAEIVREARALLRGLAPARCPRLRAVGPLGAGWSGLVTDALPGRSAKALAAAGADPRALVAAARAALAEVHSGSAPSGSPLTLDRTLAEARARLAAGAIDPRAFAPRYGRHPQTPAAREAELDAIAAELHGLAPAPPVRLHGDPCLPNLLLGADLTPVGWVDLGRVAPGDPAWDHALLRWSLAHNLGPAAGEALLDGAPAGLRARVDLFARLLPYVLWPSPASP